MFAFPVRASVRAAGLFWDITSGSTWRFDFGGSRVLFRSFTIRAGQWSTGSKDRAHSERNLFWFGSCVVFIVDASVVLLPFNCVPVSAAHELDEARSVSARRSRFVQFVSPVTFLARSSSCFKSSVDGPLGEGSSHSSTLTKCREDCTLVYFVHLLHFSSITSLHQSMAHTAADRLQVIQPRPSSVPGIVLCGHEESPHLSFQVMSDFDIHRLQEP